MTTLNHSEATIQKLSHLGVTFRCFSLESVPYVLHKDAEILVNKSIPVDACTALKDISGIESIDTRAESLSGNTLALPMINLIEMILNSNHLRISNLVNLLVQAMPASDVPFTLDSPAFSITFTPKQ
jgi:hypothetical protein